VSSTTAAPDGQALNSVRQILYHTNLPFSILSFFFLFALSG
jgi:hypothetical protein